jgi:hypothetical protein
MSSIFAQNFSSIDEDHKELSLSKETNFKTECRNPTLGLSVRVKPTLPKVGTWSPSGLPKTQSSSSGVKTPRIEISFIPLKRS